MRFLRHSLSGLFLLCLTLGLLALAGQLVFSAVQERISAEPEVPERRERVFAVNVIDAQEQTIRPILTAFGEVQSRRTLEIRAKASGTLVELAEEFEEGGQVQAGQVLGLIDPADAYSTLERTKSDLLDAQAEVREAARGKGLAEDEVGSAREQAALRERAYQRQLDLETRGVGTAATVEVAELAAAQARQAVLSSRQALAQAEARVDQADNRLARAEIARDEAERRVADTKIVAGFAGTLADVSVVQGGLVGTNEQLALLIDPQTLEVAFRISTAQYGRLLDASGVLMNAPAQVRMETFGLELTTTAVISRDSAAVGEGQTGRLLFAAMDEPGGMKPGDFVTLRIEEPALHNVVRLPATALGSDSRVLVVEDDARLGSVPVVLLRRQGDDILVRASGLKGQRVVTDRSPLLGKGIKVRVLDDNASAATDDTAMLALSEDRRARLIAYVEADTKMPKDVKTRLLSQLSEAQVPARMVTRLERRMGG
ncbi:MAG: efflux transporter periplasmic adaptor subunit [Roseovarius sp.]|nr:efflux transporter periplasmic adaptor subunit [Roseovarius sp.]